MLMVKIRIEVLKKNDSSSNSNSDMHENVTVRT
jgi:hypothetical protein